MRIKINPNFALRQNKTIWLLKMEHGLWMHVAGSTIASTEDTLEMLMIQSQLQLDRLATLSIRKKAYIHEIRRKPQRQRIPSVYRTIFYL